MKKQRLPKGWTEKQLRELARHHDQLSEDEQAKEIEDAARAKGRTMIVVPTRLVPQIQALIAGKRSVARKA